MKSIQVFIVTYKHRAGSLAGLSSSATIVTYVDHLRRAKGFTPRLATAGEYEYLETAVAKLREHGFEILGRAPGPSPHEEFVVTVHNAELTETFFRAKR